MTTFEKSLAYLDKWYIAKAVFRVYSWNHRRGSVPKPDADDWAIVDNLRLEVWTQARAHWLHMTGEDGEHRFPYSVDANARLYYRFRKRSARDLEVFADELGEPRIIYTERAK